VPTFASAVSQFRRAICVAAILSVFTLLCACADPARDLHTADVPVAPLVHHLEDPTKAYPEQFPMQVAVYWSNSDSVLEIVHSLSEMGVPFFITRDLDQALKHRLVMIYPTADGRTFTEAQIARLTQHVQNGGSIFAVNVFAGGLRAIFGFHDYAASRRRYRVDFVDASDPITRYLNRPEEKEVRLGDPKLGDIFWTNGYTPEGHATVVARFEDGTAALLRNNFGKGVAYLAGVSYFDAVLRSQVDRDYEAQRHYVNQFEPGADVWLLLLRAWYESEEPGAVRLDTIPSGQDSVLLLSHDVDWENSFAPGLDYARMEKQHGARSTFFIQTKYVSDYNSKSFFFGKDLEDLNELYTEGSTIGSHSIIHSRGFNHFDLGTGTEAFPAYQPRGTGFESATGATVFGEVRVSKSLIDGALVGHHTIFFRAGHLRVPDSLPEALQRCGYEFDSSFTADDVLSNFPYAMPLGVGFAEDSGIYEFPVTFEDEEQPPLLQRVDSMLEVVRANAENGAINVLLIHPNRAADKLQAEQKLLENLPHDVTATDMQSYAEFWRGRAELQWSVEAASGPEIRLKVTAAEPVSGLTLDFGRSIASVDSGAKLLPDGHRVILPDLTAGQSITFAIRYVE